MHFYSSNDIGLFSFGMTTMTVELKERITFPNDLDSLMTFNKYSFKIS
jgi:hypothetical protein